MVVLGVLGLLPTVALLLLLPSLIALQAEMPLHALAILLMVVPLVLMPVAVQSQHVLGFEVLPDALVLMRVALQPPFVLDTALGSASGAASDAADP